ncbi:MAG TPA: GNAT family N-acetyltransferase [Pseudolabrys sp.]|nr:GNAT family N-acetyltransferase [Pseudolabrys sp.]
MSNIARNGRNDVRPLRSADLERVIAIDSSHIGEPRRHFFEKRLAHAQRYPDDYVQIGVVRNSALAGFVFARIMRGEFGSQKTIAVLDAVAVEHDNQSRGVGRALMTALAEMLRQKGVHSLESQADWTNHSLLRFFDVSGFGLAPRMVLERSVSNPMIEPIEEE